MNFSWVLDPGCGFAALAQRLAAAGWRLASAAEAPLLPGEPEHAVFERAAGERLQYSFNPVCLLRVLESGTAPDADTLAALPLAGSESVGAWLAASDERTLWRGVLSARLLGQFQWLPHIEALRAHASSLVAKAAAAAAQEMGATLAAAAPQWAAASIELLLQQARPLLQALVHETDGRVLQMLRPRETDADRAFVPSAAAAARAAYATVWQQPPRPARAAPGARLQCHAAPAGMLADDNALSRPFPGGYRALAALLQPQRVWLAWKVIAPGRDAGMAYDGLVWLDDHWAWFPKPYRVLAPLLKGDAQIGDHRPMHATIFHNPACSNSRNALALLRERGIEPEIVDYLQTPPSVERLAGLVAAMGITPRELLRSKEPQYAELGLDDAKWTDAQLIAQMARHPVLMNRPIVETPHGTRLCRPGELVLDLLGPGQA